MGQNFVGFFQPKSRYDLLPFSLRMYRYKHEQEMSIASIAQASAIQLYSRRFFPYYTFNILGGLDENGHGAVYSYDPVGSFERESFRAGGSAAALIQPFLDNQVAFRIIYDSWEKLCPEVNVY